MGDNPVFKSDNYEMESQRGNSPSGINTKINNDEFSTIDIRTQESDKKVGNFKEEFDPQLSLRFKILVGAAIVVLIWIIIHFSFIQDYSKSDMDDM